MLLKHKASDDLVEIMALDDLFSPARDKVTAKVQAGQEEQDPQEFKKTDLLFPSGEEMPRCWIDANYQMDNAPAGSATSSR